MLRWIRIRCFVIPFLAVLVGCGTPLDESQSAQQTRLTVQNVAAAGTAQAPLDEAQLSWSGGPLKAYSEGSVVGAIAVSTASSRPHCYYDLEASVDGSRMDGRLIGRIHGCDPLLPDELHFEGSMRGVALGGQLFRTDANRTPWARWDGWWTSAVSYYPLPGPSLWTPVVSSARGVTAWIEVAFDPGGRSIAGIQNDLILPEPRFQIVDCAVNSELEKELYWAPLPAQNGIRVFVTSLNRAPSAILVPKWLYRCSIAVPEDLASGVYRAEIAGARGADPASNPQEVIGYSGSIRVTE